MKGRCHGHRWVRLDDPIFRARHWVFFGPCRSLCKAAKTAGRLILDAPDDNLAGQCGVAEGGGATIVFVNSEALQHEHLDTLAHELHHAATRTLLDANVPLTYDTTEVAAYYHEWLFREARKGLGW